MGEDGNLSMKYGVGELEVNSSFFDILTDSMNYLEQNLICYRDGCILRLGATSC